MQLHYAISSLETNDSLHARVQLIDIRVLTNGFHTLIFYIISLFHSLTNRTIAISTYNE